MLCKIEIERVKKSRHGAWSRKHAQMNISQTGTAEKVGAYSSSQSLQKIYCDFSLKIPTFNTVYSTEYIMCQLYGTRNKDARPTACSCTNLFIQYK